MKPWIALAAAAAGAIAVTHPARAGNVAVAPDCGTSSTHFIVTGGGLPSAPYPCPDTCHFNASFKLDGSTLNVHAANCSPDSFFVDLHDVPGQGCVACGLLPGWHRVTFSGSTECAPGFELPSPCVLDSFEIASSIVDPWTELLSFGGQMISMEFNPCIVCDVAPCDSIYLIQVVQPLEDLGGGLPLSPSTYARQGFGDAASRDAQLTPQGYAVDSPPRAPDPYCMAYVRGMAAWAVGHKDLFCLPAFCSDNPNRGDNSYQPGTQRIVLKFEIGAFCASGDAQGQWFGTYTWMWQRPGGGPDTITIGSHSRSWPSQQFMDALALWESLHRTFSLPGFPTPHSGGIPCNP